MNEMLIVTADMQL